MQKRFLLYIFFILSFGLGFSVIEASKIKTATISFEFPSKAVAGSITGFESSSVIDWEHPENSIFEGSVAANTLDTDNRFRNWHLKGGKYFDADNFPKISYKSKQVVSNEDGILIVEGDLTIKDITKPMTISFIKNGKQIIGTAKLYSLDYGIKIKKKREENLVKVRFTFDLE